MNIKSKLKQLGIAVILVTAAINLQFANSDYGIKENNIGAQVFSQAATTGYDNTSGMTGGDETDGSSSAGKKYFKEVLTGQHLYVTKVHAGASFNLKVGMRISASAYAQANGQVDAELKNDYAINCFLDPAGNWPYCSQQDWTICNTGGCPTPTGNPGTGTGTM